MILLKPFLTICCRIAFTQFQERDPLLPFCFTRNSKRDRLTFCWLTLVLLHTQCLVEYNQPDKMLLIWPVLVYFFTAAIFSTQGADFQALIFPSGVAGIDQAGKWAWMIKTDQLFFLALVFKFRYAKSSHLWKTYVILLINSLVFGWSTYFIVGWDKTEGLVWQLQTYIDL